MSFVSAEQRNIFMYIVLQFFRYFRVDFETVSLYRTYGSLPVKQASRPIDVRRGIAGFSTISRNI